MSKLPQLIQGSWAELSARAEGYKDRNDLLLIIPGDAATEENKAKDGMTLAEALKGRTGLVSFEPSDLSEDTGRKYAALLAEKYRKEQQ